MKFKLVIFFIFNLFFASAGFSQNYQYAYYFDKDMNSCKKQDAVIIGKGYKEANLFKVDYFYSHSMLLLMSVKYTDSLLSVPQGHFKSYYTNTRLEKEGNYDNGMMQGLWEQWNENGLKTDSIIYQNDIKIRYAKFDYYGKNERLSSYSFTDSLGNTFEEKYFSEKGIISSEVNFYNSKGLLKTYDSTGIIISSDDVFSRELTEAEFPGGERSWTNYLKKNLNPDVAADHNAPSGVYTVIIKFMVDKNGDITDIVAENYSGYGTAEEAIRVVKNSGKWKPAIQYGKNINAYRRQPISFSVQNQ